MFLFRVPLEADRYYLLVNLEMQFGCRYTISSVNNIMRHVERSESSRTFCSLEKYLTGTLIYFIGFFLIYFIAFFPSLARVSNGRVSSSSK